MNKKRQNPNVSDPQPSRWPGAPGGREHYMVNDYAQNRKSSQTIEIREFFADLRVLKTGRYLYGS